MALYRDIHCSIFHFTFIYDVVSWQGRLVVVNYPDAKDEIDQKRHYHCICIEIYKAIKVIFSASMVSKFHFGT